MSIVRADHSTAVAGGAFYDALTVLGIGTPGRRILDPGTGTGVGDHGRLDFDAVLSDHM